jgi:hypothetical protein
MGCLGVHFALDDEQVATLKSMGDDDERLDYLSEVIEEEFFESLPDRKQETDKAWHGIHRALTDGDFELDNGDYPLSHVIMGGESIYDGDDYFMILKTPQEVRDIATALNGFTKERLRAGYDEIDEDNAGWTIGDQDFEYTWHWFEQLIGFYQRAAAGRYWVMFTASQ